MIQDLEGINLSSDTQTLPTDAMREAMKQAIVGDDVGREDPTVNRLESIAAERVGKAAAIYVPSGHMGNLIATMVHCDRGDEVILEEGSHMYANEAGSIATLAGVMPRLVTGDRGVFDADKVRAALRAPNIHFPPTRLVCVENTHNLAGGTVVPLEILAGLRELATERGLAIHIDGARLFNAAVALGVDVRSITMHADSVMFCISKGLSAPVGSMLAGSAAFVDEARAVRKLLGGGMRQVGILAAAGIVALQEMTERLSEDHRNARVLAEGLAAIPGHAIDLETVQTNIVRYDIAGTRMSSAQYVDLLREEGIRASMLPPTGIRLVTHRHITEAHVMRVVEVARQIAAG